MTEAARQAIYSSRVDRAMHFAARAHATQQRKGTDIPYITHPVAVAWMLSNAGESEDVIIAALLHDTVEDTSTTLEEITQMFGDEVSSLVASVTERKTDSKGQERSWLERKKEQLAHLDTASDDRVLALKAADATHNMWSMVHDHEKHGPAIWERFHAGPEAQLWRYDKLLTMLTKRLASKPLLAELQAAVEAFRNIASN